jgi:hypothetical protein
MTIYYLAKVDMTYAHKNKLQKAIQDFIQDYDRELIAAHDVEQYKKTIVSGIEVLNKKFPKCSAVEATWWTPASCDERNKDWKLSLSAQTGYGDISLIHFWLYVGRLS